MHRSATCEVYFATDAAAGVRVALKLMRHRHQFVAEIEGRLSGGEALPADVVMGLAMGYADDHFHRFVGSLRKSGYRGDIVLAVNKVRTNTHTHTDTH